MVQYSYHYHRHFKFCYCTMLAFVIIVVCVWTFKLAIGFSVFCSSSLRISLFSLFLFLLPFFVSCSRFWMISLRPSLVPIVLAALSPPVFPNKDCYIRLVYTLYGVKERVLFFHVWMVAKFLYSPCLPVTSAIS